MKLRLIVGTILTIFIISIFLLVIKDAETSCSKFEFFQGGGPALNRC